MPLPKFVVIGAPRCGTRWISQCLSEHPQIAVPKDEVYYFTTRRIVHSFWYKGLQWYSNIFDKIIGPDTVTWGEVTPVYLYEEDTPQRMYDTIPEAKIICCVRDQYDRAYSWYLFFLAHNYAISKTKYTFRSFLTYCNQVFASEGFYLDHIRRYLDFYPTQSIVAMCYDDLVDNPVSFIQRIYQFLGVDSSFSPASVSSRINCTEMPKQTFMPRFLFHDSRNERWHQKDDDIRKMMLRIFREHNKELGEYLGRELSHWNSGESGKK